VTGSEAVRQAYQVTETTVGPRGHRESCRVQQKGRGSSKKSSNVTYEGREISNGKEKTCMGERLLASGTSSRLKGGGSRMVKESFKWRDTQKKHLVGHDLSAIDKRGEEGITARTPVRNLNPIEERRAQDQTATEGSALIAGLYW